MKNIWKRASGVLKDKGSIWLASLSRRTALRNPDIEAAVIKSTSHDESCLNYRNVRRVFAWVRVSPAYLKPLVWAISIRIKKTRSWVVALKGLMLMHGVFCCKVPAVHRIGRLPFDLSGFKDEHEKPEKTQGHNDFIRAYYLFLEQKSSFLFIHQQEHNKEQLHRISENQEDEKLKSPEMEELVSIQRLQDLLDMLLQIKPNSKSMVGPLVLEAMDCLVIEIFENYSQICSGVSKILNAIHSAGKAEGSMGLNILQKATKQGQELSLYFEFCRKIGVTNAASCPKVELISEEDIKELELIISGVSEKNGQKSVVHKESSRVRLETRTTLHERHHSSKDDPQVIITNNWQVFNEDHPSNSVTGEEVKASEDPLVPLIPLLDTYVNGNNKEFPNLISF